MVAVELEFQLSSLPSTVGTKLTRLIVKESKSR